MTIDKFIKLHDIRMVVSRTSSNPHMPDWKDASHYTIQLSTKGRQMQVYYSMGAAHKSGPTLANVLDCLAMEAASIDEARSFAEWANDLGWDDDSIKAKRAYKAGKANSAKLKALLGASAYETLLYKVERQ